MRIGVDIREFEKGKSTGIGRFLRNFLNFMAKNDRENEYVLFGNQKTDFVPVGTNQRVRIIPEKVTFVWDQFILPRVIKEEGVDVFFSPYFKCPVLAQVKLMTVVYDLIPLVVPEYHAAKHCLRRFYYKNFIQWTISRVHTLITTSVHSKEDLIRRLDIPAAKIKVAPASVSDVYQPQSSDYRAVLTKYGIAQKFIFYFGNLKPHKNVATLIEAYHALSETIKRDYLLVLGGKKDQFFEGLLDLVKTFGMEENVVFTDFIAEEDLPCLYSAAEVFVFPSFYEGFGLPVLEAMACGTPVITSNISSLPEVAGDAAILVSPTDISGWSEAITQVLVDQEKRQTLKVKGLERAKDFSIEKMSNRLLNVLQGKGWKVVL